MILRIVDRRSHQNYLIHQQRIAPCQFPRVNSTQAMADNYQLALGLDAELGKNSSQPINRASGTIGVGEDPREVHLMAAGPQPISEWIQGGIARHEAGNQKDRSGTVRPLRDRPRPCTSGKLRYLSHNAKFLEQVQKVQARSAVAVTHAVSIATPRETTLLSLL